MNTSVIDDLGISYLTTFVCKTKLIKPELKSSDKYPLWDGELILYKTKNNNKVDNIEGRVPVQVKSSEKEKVDFEKESYSVSRIALEKYAKEGGVLFIRVLYNNETDKYGIYASLLMKGDIIEILNNSKKGCKTKSINLPRVYTPSEILTHMQNFLLHKDLQMQIPMNFKGISKLPEKLYFKSYFNDIRELAKKEQYAYAKVDRFDMYAYVGKIKTGVLKREVDMKVSTDKKDYYDYVYEIVTETDRILQINNYISYVDKKFKFKNKLNKSLSLDKNIYDLEFMLDLYKSNSIIINGKKIEFEIDSNKDILSSTIENLEKTLNYLYEAKKMIESINLPISISTDDVIKYEKEICFINNVINKKELANYENDHDYFINIIPIGEIYYPIFLLKEKEGYKAYNFLKDQFVLEYINKDLPIFISRYYDSKSNVLSKFLINKEDVIDEIKKCTINEDSMYFLSNLLMEFIKSYDLNNNDLFLDLSMDMNEYLKDKDYYLKEYYILNKYQILARKKDLNTNDLKEIRSIKVNSIEKGDYLTVCTCLILLKEYDEYNIYFNKLDEDNKTIFKSWAIYNLLKEEK